jgi:hypothetical protein
LVEEESRHKLAFSSPLFGHYQYTRMPFGLKTAPATMQRLMNAVKRLGAFVYMDDIVQFADTLPVMETRMRALLTIFRAHNLKLEPEKCQFLKKEIQFLGHRISRDGISPSMEKIAAVKAFPTPTNPPQIKAFLGLLGYYRRSYSKPRGTQLCGVR